MSSLAFSRILKRSAFEKSELFAEGLRIKPFTNFSGIRDRFVRHFNLMFANYEAKFLAGILVEFWKQIKK